MSFASVTCLSDVELVRNLLGESKSAWREFTHRYDALIYASIDRELRKYPRLSTCVERDEVRATLLLSLLARDKHKLRVFDFGRGVRFSSWLGLLAANTARDCVRAARVRSTYILPLIAGEYADQAVSGPLEELLEKEVLTRVMTEIERLSAKDRQLLELLFVQACEPAQVAATMNISVDTVYTKKHKLRFRLKRAIDAEISLVHSSAPTDTPPVVSAINSEHLAATAPHARSLPSLPRAAAS